MVALALMLKPNVPFCKFILVSRTDWYIQTPLYNQDTWFLPAGELSTTITVELA